MTEPGLQIFLECMCFKMYKKEIKGKDKEEVITLIGRIYIKQIIINLITSL